MSSATYDRAPSPKLRRLLAPGGFLAPLLAKRTLGGIELDVHLGRGDEVLVYCGLTRLVKCGPGTGKKIWVKSHKSYATQTCAQLLIRPGRAKEVDQGKYLRDANRARSGGAPSADAVFLRTWYGALWRGERWRRFRRRR